MKPRYVLVGLAAVSAIAVATPAIGASNGASGPWAEQAAPAKKIAKKALRRSKKALKKSRKALRKARKVNGRQGPQGEPGPTGPEGPQGEQGPTGPQGPAGSNATAGTMGLASVPTGVGTLYAPLTGTGGEDHATVAPYSNLSPPRALTLREFAIRVPGITDGDRVTATVQLENQDTAVVCTIEGPDDRCESSAEVVIPPRSLIGLELFGDLSVGRVAAWSWIFEDRTE